MSKSLAILIVIAVVIVLFALGALSEPLGLSTRTREYFMILAGMVLGYVIAQVRQKYKK